MADPVQQANDMKAQMERFAEANSIIQVAMAANTQQSLAAQSVAQANISAAKASNETVKTGTNAIADASRAR